MESKVSVIKYEGNNDTFIWKHPVEDFNTLSQLIVHESQEAIFLLNGQALDLFGPGRHTLETQNIPMIGKLLKLNAKGANPFHCEVYFINKTIQMGIKWGTPDKVRFIDPVIGAPFEIGASGEMNLMVKDSRKLLLKLVGTMNGISWSETGSGFTKSIQNSFRPLIVTQVKDHLAKCIKKEKINLLEIDEHLVSLSQSLRNEIVPTFEEYGLTIPEFYISNIALPDDDINFRKYRDTYTVQIHTKLAEAEAKIIEAQRLGELEKQKTSLLKAEYEAQRRVVEAKAEADSLKLTGFAQADVMARQGYSQKDVIQADVSKAMAEGIGNMNISGGAGGGAGEMIGLMAGLGAVSVVGPQIKEAFEGINGTKSSSTVAAQVSQQKTCSKCGAVLSENNKFCPECGERVLMNSSSNIICPKCGKEVAKAKFCSECGAKLVSTCSKCGCELQSGTKFCPECGTKNE